MLRLSRVFLAMILVGKRESSEPLGRSWLDAAGQLVFDFPFQKCAMDLPYRNFTHSIWVEATS